MLIQTRFLGPTNTLGSRVKATFVGRNMSVTVSYSHGASDPHAVAAEALVARWNREALAYSSSVGQDPQYSSTITGSFYCVGGDDRGYFYARVQDCQERAFRADPSVL